MLLKPRHQTIIRKLIEVLSRREKVNTARIAEIVSRDFPEYRPMPLTDLEKAICTVLYSDHFSE